MNYSTHSIEELLKDHTAEQLATKLIAMSKSRDKCWIMYEDMKQQNNELRNTEPLTRTTSTTIGADGRYE